MRYIPGASLKREQPQQEVQPMQPIPIEVVQSETYPYPHQPMSEMGVFYNWSMELDTQYETEEFKRDHADLIRAIKKAPAMSNLDVIDEYRIKLLWDDIKFSLQHGMKERAEQKSLELYRLYVDSRGLDGFGSKVMVTQHNIIEERRKSQPEARGIGGWFKKPKAQQETPSVYPMEG